MFCWESEGRYRCTKCMTITPFWFSTEHRWEALTPFWLSVDELYTNTNVDKQDEYYDKSIWYFIKHVKCVKSEMARPLYISFLVGRWQIKDHCLINYVITFFFSLPSIKCILPPFYFQGKVVTVHVFQMILKFERYNILWHVNVR